MNAKQTRRSSYPETYCFDPNSDGRELLKRNSVVGMYLISARNYQSNGEPPRFFTLLIRQFYVIPDKIQTIQCS